LKEGNTDMRRMQMRRGGWVMIGMALVLSMAVIATGCLEQPGEEVPKVSPVSLTSVPGSMNDSSLPPVLTTGKTGFVQEETGVPPIAGTSPAPGVDVYRPAIRAAFDARYPVTKDTVYPLLIEPGRAGWLDLHLPDAVLLKASAKFMMPPATGTFLAWKGGVYEMPGDFNAFAADSGIQVTNASDALLLADLFIKGWEPRSAYGRPLAMVLNGSADIPRHWATVPPAVAGSITPPSIVPEDGAYRLHLFTWSEVNGMTREWTMVVFRNGTVEAGNTLLGKNIGDAFTLDG
jgi:hypothetical protein